MFSLYTTCSCLTNGRAYLDSGMVSIIFFLTKYCCSSIPEVPSIVVNPSDWAIDPYCSIILLSQYLLIVLSICSTCRIAALTANRHLFHSHAKTFPLSCLSTSSVYIDTVLLRYASLPVVFALGTIRFYHSISIYMSQLHK